MKKLPIDRVIAVAEADESIGFCIACGYEQDCVEPDARNYTCEDCGKEKVFGADEIVLSGYAE